MTARPPPSPSPENRTPNEECGSGQRVPAELTNCDRCAHEYLSRAGRECRKVDAFYASGDTPGALSEWVAANCTDGGSPVDGATNCPGFAPVGGAS